MHKLLQIVLLIGGVLALVALIVEMTVSVLATTHGSTPVKVYHVQAGSYPLTVSLYTYPANAGYALPFAVSSTQPLSYSVSSNPGSDVSATSVPASITLDANNKAGVQGNAEITVRGDWMLHITASGPQGSGSADVPIIATAPDLIPAWFGWLIGLIPLMGLLVFLSIQQGRRKSMASVLDVDQMPAVP